MIGKNFVNIYEMLHVKQSTLNSYYQIDFQWSSRGNEMQLSETHRNIQCQSTSNLEQQDTYMLILHN